MNELSQEELTALLAEKNQWFEELMQTPDDYDAIMAMPEMQEIERKLRAHFAARNVRLATQPVPAGVARDARRERAMEHRWG